MLKFLRHHLNRLPQRRPQIPLHVITSFRTSFRSICKSRVQYLKTSWPKMVVVVSTGVALWFTSTTIVGAQEDVSYRYGGLFDPENLQKMEESFRKHASININGELMMSEEDFITSVVGSNPTNKERAQIKACFQLADINKDHHISFFEYALFMHLNAAPDASLQMSFRLFDTNGDGYISLKEFKNVIRLHTDTDLDVHVRSTKLFGDDGKKKLNYSEFIKLLESIHQEILVQQFKMVELPEKPGFINPEQCVDLLKSRAPSPTPLYLINTFDSLIKNKEPISLSHYLAYLDVMKYLDNIELAIELYTITGGSVNKHDFSRAMHICTGKIIKDPEIDIIFGMFDVSHKGLLDRQSLSYIRNYRMKQFIYEQDNRPILSVVKSIVLGGVAAKLSSLIIYPLDKLKTRQQLAPLQLHPMTESARRIYKKEGIKGYLRGVGSMLTIVTPEKLVKLYISDYVRLLIENSQDDKRSAYLLKEAIAGMATGVVQALIVNPFEQVKIKLQMLEHRSKDGTWRSLYKLGLRKFYRGLSVAFIRDISFNMTYFTIFSWGKRKIQNENRLGSLPLFVAHATAATFAVLVSSPADTVKCVYQHSPPQNTSPLQCFWTIVKQEGLYGLYKGALPRTIVVVTLFALTFTIFDLLQRTFAPGTVLGLITWQRDLDLVRNNRLFHLEKTLKKEFGLEILPKNES